MYDVASIGFRAGFWRRSLALVIDCAIVVLPFQILAIWLYSASGGTVQATSFARECHDVQEQNQRLDPPSPEQANFAIDCKLSLFGFVTSRRLIIGRTTSEGVVTKKVSQTYDLGEGGQQSEVIRFDWIALLALIAYFITMEHRGAATFGERLVQIRVVSWKAPGSQAISLSNALLRHLSKWLGLSPLLAAAFYLYVRGEGVAFVTIADSPWWSGAACFGGVLWYLANLILIIAKRDPLYDRLARVSVLCD